MAKKNKTAERLVNWQGLLRKYGPKKAIAYAALWSSQSFKISVSKAEKFFGLDATKPAEAALLLNILAYATFSTENKGDRIKTTSLGVRKTDKLAVELLSW
jgi:hypothetical protein